MSANELADWLTKNYVVGRAGTIYKCAAMLRHQENQIQALKTQLAYLESKVYGGTTK